MNQDKKIQVLMLRTRTDSTLSKAYLANPSYLRFLESGFKDDSYSSNDNQHLYFLSDDEIKERDYAYHKLDGKVIQITNKDLLNGDIRRYGYKLVIASTDKSLGLPQPSKEWIEYYISEHNKGNIITEVMVEYGIDYEKEANQNSSEGGVSYEYFSLKVNSDNTINLKPVEDTWIDLLTKFENSTRFRSNQAFIHWLTKNNYQVPKQIKR